MLRTVYFNNQLCASAVKIHDKPADDPLLVNLHRVFPEKKIPELSFMRSHFPTKPSGIFQLAVIFWYRHCIPSPSSLCSATSPKGRGKARTVHQRCIEVRPCICRKKYSLIDLIMS